MNARNAQSNTREDDKIHDAIAAGLAKATNMSCLKHEVWQHITLTHWCDMIEHGIPEEELHEFNIAILVGQANTYVWSSQFKRQDKYLVCLVCLHKGKIIITTEKRYIAKFDLADPQLIEKLLKVLKTEYYHRKEPNNGS